MLAAIQFRGIYLAQSLRGLGCEVIETYPAAAYRAMGAIGKSYEERVELLARRLDGLGRDDHDSIDAACAALVAVDRARGPHAQSIRGQDGEIWLTRPD